MSVSTFGYTAFAPADVADASRRQPQCDLSGWAQSRGLQFRGKELPSAFLSVLPPWPDHLMNLSKGTFPNGQFGALAHRLYELETTNGGIREPGEYWGSKFTTHRSVSAMAGLTVDASNGPFDGNRAFAPTTTVVVRAPEAALLPRLLMRSAGRMTLIGSPQLDDLGLPNMRFARVASSMTSCSQLPALRWLQRFRHCRNRSLSSSTPTRRWR